MNGVAHRLLMSRGRCLLLLRRERRLPAVDLALLALEAQQLYWLLSRARFKRGRPANAAVSWPPLEPDALPQSVRGTPRTASPLHSPKKTRVYRSMLVVVARESAKQTYE